MSRRRKSPSNKLSLLTRPPSRLPQLRRLSLSNSKRKLKSRKTRPLSGTPSSRRTLDSTLTSRTTRSLLEDVQTETVKTTKLAALRSLMITSTVVKPVRSPISCDYIGRTSSRL